MLYWAWQSRREQFTFNLGPLPLKKRIKLETGRRGCSELGPAKNS